MYMQFSKNRKQTYTVAAYLSALHDVYIRSQLGLLAIGNLLDCILLLTVPTNSRQWTSDFLSLEVVGLICWSVSSPDSLFPFLWLIGSVGPVASVATLALDISTLWQEKPGSPNQFSKRYQKEHFGTLTWQTRAMDEHSDWLAALQATCAHETRLLKTFKRQTWSTSKQVTKVTKSCKFLVKLHSSRNPLLKSWLLELRSSLHVGYENGLVAFMVGHGLHK